MSKENIFADKPEKERVKRLLTFYFTEELCIM